MQYIKTTNGVPEKYSIGTLRRDNPNVSFPKKLTNEILEEYGLENIFPVSMPDHDELTQRVAEGFPEKADDGKWYRVYSVSNLDETTAGDNIRAKRDELISTEIDTVNPMRWNTMTEKQQQNWSDYRQALLDIPQQPGFPYSVEWPTKPE